MATRETTSNTVKGRTGRIPRVPDRRDKRENKSKRMRHCVGTANNFRGRSLALDRVQAMRRSPPSRFEGRMTKKKRPLKSYTFLFR